MKISPMEDLPPRAANGGERKHEVYLREKREGGWWKWHCCLITACAVVSGVKYATMKKRLRRAGNASIRISHMGRRNSLLFRSSNNLKIPATRKYSLFRMWIMEDDGGEWSHMIAAQIRGGIIFIAKDPMTRFYIDRFNFIEATQKAKGVSAGIYELRR